jgi:hypothetical protein
MKQIIKIDKLTNLIKSKIWNGKTLNIKITPTQDENFVEIELNETKN